MIRYVHTNIIAQDWQKLADFYRLVFNCEPVPPERNQSGDWLSKATGVKHAELKGIHLRLPGLGKNGPTLEIYSYSQSLAKPEKAANRLGLGHLAFEVDDVTACLANVITYGGSAVGEIVSREVADVGTLTVVYAADPEGNILELQRWA